MKYYLKVSPNCFIWHNQANCLFYNCNNNQYHLCDSDVDIIDICTQLDNCINLYSIEILPHILSKPNIVKMLEVLNKKGMAEIIIKEDNSDKPISMPPILNILRNPKKIKYNIEKHLTEDLLTYLHEVFINFGSTDNQFQLYPNINIASKYQNTISYENLQLFLQQIESQYLKRINILGNNIFLRPDRDQIYALLKKSHAKTTIYLLNESLSYIKRDLVALKNCNADINVVCTMQNDLIHIEKKLRDYNITYKVTILISSSKDYINYEKKSHFFKSQNIELKPIFIGTNLDFFKDNVFITKDTLANSNLSKREIFVNQTLNSNFFGKLTIMPDGEVYANVNHPSLGNIVTDTIYEILYKEMDKGTSWFLTRDKVPPCSDCLYRYLCPPPSNYELVIGKYNLCTIKP